MSSFLLHLETTETRQPCGRKTPCGGKCRHGHPPHAAASSCCGGAGKARALPYPAARMGKRQRAALCACLALIALICLAGLFSSSSHAEAAAQPAASNTPAASAPASGTAATNTASAPAAAAPAAPQERYGEVDLKRLVPASRMTEGGRAIFEPRPVRFQARLQEGLKPQKAEYLQKVMGMMGATEIPQVSQRVVIDYGGDKPLAVYVEDKVAERLKNEAKVGEHYTFYAFHVYNNRYGPAMVITSFGSR
jgi:hypothetical protein